MRLGPGSQGEEGSQPAESGEQLRAISLVVPERGAGDMDVFFSLRAFHPGDYFTKIFHPLDLSYMGRRHASG